MNRAFALAVVAFTVSAVAGPYRAGAQTPTSTPTPPTAAASRTPMTMTPTPDMGTTTSTPSSLPTVFETARGSIDPISPSATVAPSRLTAPNTGAGAGGIRRGERGVGVLILASALLGIALLYASAHRRTRRR